MRLTHPVFRDGDGSQYEMEGRLRLCPYYFVKGDSAQLSGILATFCRRTRRSSTACETPRCCRAGK
jgi:hypothetical protein